MKHSLRNGTALATAIFCTLAATAQTTPPLTPSDQPVTTDHAMVVSIHHDATAAGVEILRAGGNDILLVSFDAGGNYRWAKQFGNSQDQEGLGVAVDPSCHVVIVGALVLANVVAAIPGRIASRTRTALLLRAE